MAFDVTLIFLQGHLFATDIGLPVSQIFIYLISKLGRFKLNRLQSFLLNRQQPAVY